MKTLNHLILSLALALVTISSVFGNDPISAQMKQFTVWESEHNISGSMFKKFKNEAKPIPYIEVDLDAEGLYKINDFIDWIYGAERGPHGITLDFAKYLPKEIKDFMVYKKEGRKTFRWLLNPLDQDAYKGIMEYLDSRNVPYNYVGADTSEVLGYRTASKSVIVNIPGTDKSFSYKTGTSTAGQGETITRPNPSRWSHFNRRLSDYFYSVKNQLTTLDVAWEAGAVMLPPVSPSSDISINIRLMEKVSKGETYQMSGFVLNDSKEIQRLAKLAGMTEKEFRKQISYHFGQFLTEMNLVLGFRVSSAHLQNVRFELDENMRPTGRVIMLDLTDGKPIAAIFEKNGQEVLLKQWRDLVSDTTIGTNYKPNEIVDSPQWVQSELRYFGSDWLAIMDKPSLKLGVEDKLEELGSFSEEEVSVNRKGEISFKFKDKEHLLGMYGAPARKNKGCNKAMRGIFGFFR